jgi:hypothetical protein
MIGISVKAGILFVITAFDPGAFAPDPAIPAGEAEIADSSDNVGAIGVFAGISGKVDFEENSEFVENTEAAAAAASEETDGMLFSVFVSTEVSTELSPAEFNAFASMFSPIPKIFLLSKISQQLQAELKQIFV